MAQGSSLDHGNLHGPCGNLSQTSTQTLATEGPHIQTWPLAIVLAWISPWHWTAICATWACVDPDAARPSAPRWSQAADQTPGNHVAHCCNWSHTYQLSRDYSRGTDPDMALYSMPQQGSEQHHGS